MSRILVVDDDSGHRLILRSRLTEAGHELLLAESGARGLAEARLSAFDAFLVSARLGVGIDGYEVCRRLKALPERARVPVVLFSDANTSTEELLRGYEAGCEAFVSKPDLPALDHVLRVLERNRQRFAELAEELRSLQEAVRRSPVPERREGAEAPAREVAGSEAAAAAVRELASPRPDGVLLVDEEGAVLSADRAACELFAARLEGAHLGDLAPSSGLEAFVRDAVADARDGLRFDLPARKGRAPRALQAVVVPFMRAPGAAGRGLLALLLHDQKRRRLAAEALSLSEPDVGRTERACLLDAAREQWRPDALLGNGAAARMLRERVCTLAQASGPVLLRGPVGCGKQRAARTLHFSGSAAGAFLALHCGGRVEEELELELFGRARTAAAPERPGLLHLTRDGTLFLEEVHELPNSLQQSLERFLQEGCVERAGATRAERLDLRLVASSSAPLEELAQSGGFRSQLLSLLGVATIAIPPLAQRKEDVEPLARHFVGVWGAARGLSGISDDAWRVLLAFDWPGDVAQLQDCLRRACARAQGELVRLQDLPRELRELESTAPRDLIPARAPVAADLDGTHSVAGEPERELIPAGRGGAATGDPRPWDVSDDEPVSLDLYEKKALLRALHEVGGDRLAAARLLKVGKSTLYRKLKHFDIS